MSRIFILAFALVCASSFAQQGLPDTLPLAPGEKGSPDPLLVFAGITLGGDIKDALDIMKDAKVKLIGKEEGHYENVSYIYAGNNALKSVKNTTIESYKGKILSVFIEFNGSGIIAALETSLKAKYGEASHESRGIRQYNAEWHLRNGVDVDFIESMDNNSTVSATYNLVKKQSAIDKLGKL